MFIKGQKVYRWKGRMEEWTYIRKTNAEHILMDSNNQYGYFVNLNMFFENKEQYEISRLKHDLKDFDAEKSTINNKLREYKKKVKTGTQLLNKINKKINKAQKRYKYFQEKYPEEFI